MRLTAICPDGAGIVAAVQRNRFWDYLANAIGLAGLSTPTFWLGIMMILLVSVDLGWLPPSGYVPLPEDWRQSLATTIMPAFVLGNAIAAILMRHTRAAMLTALDQDYVRTARAKGLHESRVVLRHALRNALIPVVTLGAAVGRGSDRAGVFHSRLRQDDRRRGVQSRLSGRAGRRARDGVSLCDAKFARGYPLRGDQPQAPRLMTDLRGS